MHSPPSSSDIFLSSPLPCIGTVPEEEVLKLFEAAHKVTWLSQDIIAVISLHRESFLSTFGRQVQLLRSRSQAFEDAHITVYDKVLLLLTDNGNRLETPAAIAWYCKEYLGFNLDNESDRGGQMIKHALITTSTLSQALSPATSQEEVQSNVTSFPQTATNPKPKFHTSDNDPKFKHLWSVYSKAHSDYLTIADKRDNDTLEAAKFLRDTAENGIHFLEHRYPSDPKMLELKNTYNMAKLVAVALNGGKKRKFDRATDTDRKYHQHKRLSPFTAEHDRVNTMRRYREKNQEKIKPRGRGPSGIPYGYTRPVDSYYPA